MMGGVGVFSGDVSDGSGGEVGGPRTPEGGLTGKGGVVRVEMGWERWERWRGTRRD